jgi:hypothetical protein
MDPTTAVDRNSVAMPEGALFQLQDELIIQPIKS